MREKSRRFDNLLFYRMPMPSPLGRVPPKGAGEERYNIPSFRCPWANTYCGITSSVFFIALEGDEKSTFPKGEGMGATAPVRQTSVSQHRNLFDNMRSPWYNALKFP